MVERNGVSLASAGTRGALLRFEATDVTGTQALVAEEVEASLPASAVAEALAARMSLPENVPWALRDDQTSEYLADDVPIGDQIATGTRLTVTPKTHLG